MRCVCCGYEGDVAGFQEIRRSFRRRSPHCLKCLEELASARARRSSRLVALFAVVGAGAAVTLIAIEPESDAGWLAAFAVLVLLFAVVEVPLHECGHALAAKLVGYQVFKISLGRGRELWPGRIADVAVSVHESPLSGLTYASGSGTNLPRMRRVVFALGGVTVNLAVACALWGSRSSWLGEEPSRLADTVFSAALWSNTWIAIGNLLPFRVETPTGKAASDGLALVTALFSSAKQTSLWVEQHYVLGAYTAALEGDSETALDWADRGLARFPASISLGLLHSSSLGEIGQVAAARDASLALLAREDISPLVRVMLKNNVAYFDFLLEAEALCGEADRFSEEALAALPWNPALQSTRGAVLLAQGLPDAALPHLQASLTGDMRNRARADTTLLVAMAHARLGDREQAQRQLQLARALAPSVQLLERAQRAVTESNVAPRGEAPSAAC